MNWTEIIAGVGMTLAVFPAGSAPTITREEKTDAENLQGDWANIGNDLRKAIGKVEQERKDK